MQQTVFTHFLYLDPKAEKIIPNCSMLIVNGRIEKIGVNLEFLNDPEQLEIVDLHGSYVIPGLINIHCHLTGSGKKIPSFFMKRQNLSRKLTNLSIVKKIFTKMMIKNAQSAVRSGITTVRTLGDANYSILSIRDQIREGILIGPRVFTAAKGLAMEGGHGSIFNEVVNTKEEAENKTLEIIRKGADCIKIMATGGVTDALTPDEAGKPQMSVEIMKVICDIAHNHVLKVAAHCQSNEGTWNCVHAGVDTIEHGSDYTPELLREMESKNISIIPTLSAPHAYSTYSSKESGLLPVALENNKRIKARIHNGLRMALNSKIIIGAGTDAGIPMVKHNEFARELMLFNEEFGVHAFKALQIATINNARILNKSNELGSLEAGKWADFLVFDENPLENVQILFNPKNVYKSGEKIV